MLGALRQVRGLDAAAIAALFSGERFAPARAHRRRARKLEDGILRTRLRTSRATFPEWLAPAFAESFGDDAVADGRERSPSARPSTCVSTP